jgi:molybdopterin-binding protein
VIPAPDADASEERCTRWRVQQSRQETPVKLSARNILAGSIKDLHKGAVTTTVKIALKGGDIVTASITNEAAEDLELKVGDAVSAIIKAPDVIIGK